MDMNKEHQFSIGDTVICYREYISSNFSINVKVGEKLKVSNVHNNSILYSNTGIISLMHPNGNHYPTFSLVADKKDYLFDFFMTPVDYRKFKISQIL